MRTMEEDTGKGKRAGFRVELHVSVPWGNGFRGILRCVCTGGRGEQQMEMSWKNVNEREHTGSKANLTRTSLFLRAQEGFLGKASVWRWSKQKNGGEADF